MLKKQVLSLLAFLVVNSCCYAVCDTAYFAYPDTVFCNVGPTVSPDTVSSASGYFSASSPGLSVDSLGAIAPSLSSPGTYNLFYVIQDSCADSFAVSITILQQGNSAFGYNNPIYCTPTTNPLPIVLGDSGGMFFGSNGVVVDSLIGEINLPGSSPGSHSVTYVVDSLCPDTTVTSVFIYPKRDGSFSYSDTLLCTNGPSQQALILGDTGGVFSSAFGLALNPSTGAINPGNSAAGNYTVQYEIAGSCGDTGSVQVQVVPSTDPSFSYPANICISDTANPIPSVLNPGGTFSEQTGNLVFQNTSTGEINLSGTIPGAYSIQYITTGICPDSLSMVVTILDQSNPSFVYPDTSYCNGEVLAAPVMLGVGGGTFWCLDTALSIDTATGFIDLIASDTGIYTVYYATPGVCPDTSTFDIEIVPQGVSSFAYIPSEFCQSDPNPIPAISGDTNGVFSVVFGNLSINPITGEIDLSASATGDSIIIKYTVPGPVQNCPDSSLFLIKIVEPDTSISITYPKAAYCPGEGNPYPAIVGPSGGTFQANPPTLAFVSQFTGEISLAQSQPGQYQIRYFPPGACTDTSSGFWLTINQRDVLNLGYPSTQFCKGDSVIHVANLPDSLGTFTEPSGFLAFTNTSTGSIILDSSRAGNYIVRYESGGACPADTAWPIQIFDSPDPLLISTADQGTICKGDSVDFAAFGGDRYEFAINDSVARQLSFLGEYRPGPGLSDGDQISVRVVNDAGQCQSFDTIAIQVLPRPAFSYLEYDDKIESGEDIEIDVQVDQDSFFISWAYTTEGAISPASDSVVSPLLREGSIYQIESEVVLSDPNTLGKLYYTIQPFAGGCAGLVESLEILLLPGDDLFIPGVITPDGNGKNDVWEIRYADNVIPDHYQLVVFNRSGGEVYSQEGLAPIWNGGNLPDGVYWWVAKNKVTRKEIAGGVTIRRK